MLSKLLPTVTSIDTTTLTNLPELKPQPPPTFPTFSELVFESMNEQPVGKREIGLFEGLMGNDPRPLFQDLVDYPHKYQPGTDVLLQELITGQKTIETLSPDESLLLDYATLEYTQPSRTPVEEPEPLREVEEDPADYLPELRSEVDDEPPTVGPMNAYWWLQ